MSGASATVAGHGGAAVASYEESTATREPTWVKWTLIAISMSFFSFFLLMPLFAVFTEALRKGWDVYFAALTEPDAVSAIKLTLIAASIAVPLNLVFGLTAAWSIAKFQFPGKQFLITLINLPFSLSQLVSCLLYLSIFCAQGCV